MDAVKPHTVSGAVSPKLQRSTPSEAQLARGFIDLPKPCAFSKSRLELQNLEERSHEASSHDNAVHETRMHDIMNEGCVDAQINLDPSDW